MKFPSVRNYLIENFVAEVDEKDVPSLKRQGSFALGIVAAAPITAIVMAVALPRALGSDTTLVIVMSVLTLLLVLSAIVTLIYPVNWPQASPPESIAKVGEVKQPKYTTNVRPAPAVSTAPLVAGGMSLVHPAVLADTLFALPLQESS